MLGVGRDWMLSRFQFDQMSEVWVLWGKGNGRKFILSPIVLHFFDHQTTSCCQLHTVDLNITTTMGMP